MSGDVGSWIRERAGEVPEELLSWLEPDGDAGPDDGDPDPLPELERRGLAALAEATSGPSEDRRTAFRLLAADAYLTCACEAALDRPDPEPALRALLRRVADRVP